MMRPALAAALLASTLASAGQTAAELAREVEELKAQVAALSKRAPPRIGIVNLVRVFDELEQTVDMNAQLQQIKEKHEDRLREFVTRIRDLEDKSKLMRPESEEGKKNLRQLEEAKRELRAYRKASEDHIYNKLFVFAKSTVMKIRAEIQAYANEGGYDFVLRGRDADLGNFERSVPPRMRYLDLNRRIESHNVLFAKTAYDFTEDIIKRLNETNQREKDEKAERRLKNDTKAEK